MKFLLFFVACSLHAAHLEYAPGRSVLHTAKIMVEGESSGSRFASTVIIQALLTLSGGDYVEPPFEISFTLKSYSRESKMGDWEKRVDTTRPEAADVASLAHIINKPLTLHVEQGFTIAPDSLEINEWYKEQPALKALLSPAYFQQLFEPFFLLAGEDLQVGSTFERSLAGEPVTLTVTAVTDKEIQAKLQGQARGELTFQRAHAVKFSGWIDQEYRDQSIQYRLHYRVE